MVVCFLQVLAPLGADTAGSQFLEPDGTFPNHIPNPENKDAMAAAVNMVKKSGQHSKSLPHVQHWMFASKRMGLAVLCTPLCLKQGQGLLDMLTPDVCVRSAQLLMRSTLCTKVLMAGHMCKCRMLQKGANTEPKTSCACCAVQVVILVSSLTQMLTALLLWMVTARQSTATGSSHLWQPSSCR